MSRRSLSRSSLRWRSSADSRHRCFSSRSPHLSYFSIVLYGVVFIIGTLVGLEIPLLMRILKDELDFKDLVSRVLAFDYIGALVASLLFPIFLVPRLGSEPHVAAFRNAQRRGRHLGHVAAAAAYKAKRHAAAGQGCCHPRPARRSRSSRPTG